MQSSAQGHKTKNKNAVIRQRSVEYESEAKLDVQKQKTEKKKRKTQYDTTRMIKVETDGKAAEDAVLYLEMIANVFMEGVVVFDYGIIYVYFNLWPGFLKDIEHTAHEKQKEISQLLDVYSKYKTFLLYRTKNGKELILPQNQNFQIVFKRLRNVRQNDEKVTSNMMVMLKDINNLKHDREQLFKMSGDMKHEPNDYHVNYIFSQKLKTRLYESASEETMKGVTGTDLYVESNVSLEIRKEKTNTSSLKVRAPDLPNHRPLPWLPPSLSIDRMTIQYPFREEFLLPLPVQVSEEQRDDTQAYSEQVVTQNLSTTNSDDISYGLNQPSVGNNSRYSQVTDYTQTAVQEPRNQLQHRPRVPPRHPNYSDYSDRLMSYANWRHRTPDPSRLSQAGFFFTKDRATKGTPLKTTKLFRQTLDISFEDQVHCFACDGGLRRWDPEDDPWTEHCRWFPACPSALQQKGEQFIALIQASVENEGYGASGGGVQDLTTTMTQLKIKESVIETIMTEQGAVCLDMGYSEEDVKNAVKELLERGNETPSLEEIIVLIDVIRERKLYNTHSSSKESPLEENNRLRGLVYCMSCSKNNVNALFLPCTHHELCMTCAEPLKECPVCHREIREKIRTYMA